MKHEPINRVFLDIETAPNIGYFWQAGHEQNINHDCIIKERAVICVCWMRDGEETVHRLLWQKPYDDKALIKALLPVLADADEVVAHNANRFDIPWLRTRALKHGFRFPEVKVVDTLRIAWGKFRFNSSRLDYLAKFLGVGAKGASGWKLWEGAIQGDEKALNALVDYCAQDVRVLAKVYAKLAPHVRPATHAGVFDKKPAWSCPHCGTTQVKKTKTRVTPTGSLRHQFVCAKGHYYTVSNAAFKGYKPSS